MRAVAVLAAGSFDAAAAVDTVRLDFDGRHRRRIMLITEGGHELLLDLPRAARLHDGDGLALASGGVVVVRAQPEPLAEIRAADATALARIAWHLGNRHVPVQLAGATLRIRADHVIEAMVCGLGGEITALEAPFDPEPGAYAGSHSHPEPGGHNHSHDA